MREFGVLPLHLYRIELCLSGLRRLYRPPLFPCHPRPSLPHINISVPVDPLEWQISQDTANSIFAGLVNTIGAAESVLRVAATGHDKRLFLKVVICLYLLSALGRLVSGVTVAYTGLCLFCLYMLAENSQLISSWFLQRRDPANLVQDDV